MLILAIFIIIVSYFTLGYLLLFVVISSLTIFNYVRLMLVTFGY
jgi:hypothetical protein